VAKWLAKPSHTPVAAGRSCLEGYLLSLGKQKKTEITLKSPRVSCRPLRYIAESVATAWASLAKMFTSKSHSLLKVS
jgi:hypothetical protein